jgi:ribonuclease BN (tRNA processing enzyme)
MSRRPLSSCLALVTLCTLLFAATLQAETRVIILGTGTPVPDPERAGPGVAVVVDGEAYVFDAGSGVLQRAVQAMTKYGLPGLMPQNIKYLFLTHLHSDHIHDVADLASSRWWGRTQRLAIFGPAGLKAYNDNMTAMARIEADLRAAGTPPQLVTDREGYQATATEISDGVVFRNDAITVEAFTVPHGDIKPAYGYKVTTADKTIVISGDTAYSEALAAQAKGADILIHEVMSGDHLASQSEFWQLYHGSSHTRASEVARVANIARPQLVVLYHILFFDASATEIVAEVTRDYDGQVVLANDLDAF